MHKNNRSGNVDFLRLILALAVVSIHAGMPFPTSDFSSYFFRHGIFRIAVPVFFVINGFYLFNAIDSVEKMLTWSKRLVAMYCFWMLLYLPFYFPDRLTLRSVVLFAEVSIFGYFQLWYVSALIMAAWILFFARSLSTKKILIIVISLFVLGALLQYLAAYRGIPVRRWLYRGPLLFAFPLLTLGMLLRKHEDFFMQRNFALYGFLIGAIGLVTEAWVYSTFRMGSGGFDIYFSLILLCPALFLLAKDCRISVPGNLGLAKISSAIYFIHPLFMWLLKDFLALGLGGFFYISIIVCCLMACPLLFLASRKFKFII